MCENQDTDGLLTKADEVYQRINVNLQKRCTIVHTFEKTVGYPLWCDCLKEALLLRSTELAITAIELYRSNRLVSTSIIIRSILETAALLNRLYETCAKFINTHNKCPCCDDIIQELHAAIGKISIPSTDKIGRNISPYKPSSLIKAFDTRFKLDGMAYRTYVGLSQMSHTNFQGCWDSFIKVNTQNQTLEFIQDYHHARYNTDFHFMFMCIILEKIEVLQYEITKLLPEFTEILKKYEND